MTLSISLTPEDAQRLNNFLYAKFVTEDGINFKSPFLPGTLEYLDVNIPFIWDDNAEAALNNLSVSEEDRDFLLALKITGQVIEG